MRGALYRLGHVQCIRRAMPRCAPAAGSPTSMCSSNAPAFENPLGRAQPPQSLHLSGATCSMERLLVARVPSSESIGACSLDVDASESSAVLAARTRPMGKEASEITLRSMAVSATTTAQEGGPTQQPRGGGTLDGNVAQLSNGCWNVGGSSLESSTKPAEHRPSYLGISCAINGYTSYSQFCRSRDSSPARLSPRTLAPLVTSPGRDSAKVEPIPEGKAHGRELSNGRGHHNVQSATSAAGPSTSLVQQRILALYGSEAAERVARSRTRTAKSPLKLEMISKRSPSCPAQVVRGRSKSPPVFRHLTRHFKEHLRLSEVSASQTENLPGFVPGSRPLLLGSPEKRLPSSVVLRAAGEVDRGHNGVLQEEEDSLERSLHCQVVNGGGALKLNGSHGLLMAVDEVDKARIPGRSAQTQHPPPGVGSSAKALSSSDLPRREGHAFLATVCSTQESLEARIREAQRDLDDAAVPEDIKGQIRATIGKANLLITQKFKQFTELCHRNIEPNAGDSFPTTGSDLAGFWDMVMLQVENVHALFEELNMLRANNWEEPKKTGSTRVAALRPAKRTAASRSVPASPKRSEKSEEAARSRLEARKRLMEAKRQARQSQARGDEDIAIFVPQEKHN
ncbi:uncharacterized protein LOC144178165 isoform X4 [Haemaphysalis longicornis]|uniref:Guanylate-kinase-associated protein n=1 Tax=Haemaphysalis longicornis TaxID=44386 RepID=A0A9J6H7M0_HAELO|nr:hypothetical protein HPB48_023856 [Haemaphysalis longicornis]